MGLVLGEKRTIITGGHFLYRVSHEASKQDKNLTVTRTIKTKNLITERRVG